MKAKNRVVKTGIIKNREYSVVKVVDKWVNLLGDGKPLVYYLTWYSSRIGNKRVHNPIIGNGSTVKRSEKDFLDQVKGLKPKH